MGVGSCCAEAVVQAISAGIASVATSFSFIVASPLVNKMNLLRLTGIASPAAPAITSMTDAIDLAMAEPGTGFQCRRVS
jgi:hypothetical protein